MIDASTGAHLWADRFDGELHDVFALQDDIAGRSAPSTSIWSTSRAYLAEGCWLQIDVARGWAVGCETVGEGVILRFDDGSTAEGDALIGADGIHLVIRAGLHGLDNAEFTGLVAWRGVIPMEDLPPRTRRHKAR